MTKMSGRNWVKLNFGLVVEKDKFAASSTHALRPDNRKSILISIFFLFKEIYVKKRERKKSLNPNTVFLLNEYSSSFYKGGKK